MILSIFHLKIIIIPQTMIRDEKISLTVFSFNFVNSIAPAIAPIGAQMAILKNEEFRGTFPFVK